MTGTRTIGVVGAGAAGTLVTAQLAMVAARTGTPLEVLLIDPGRQTGNGGAYATTDPRPLLNVGAAGRSASPDAPDHFVRWRAEAGGGAPADPDRYARRETYGRYLRDV